jgi:hypothetical protein
MTRYMRRGWQAVMVALLAVLATACASGSGDGDTDAEPADDPPVTIDDGGATSELGELYRLIEDTVSLPRLAFELEVTMSVPGGGAPVHTLATGSYDEENQTGVGTRSYSSEDAAVAAAFPSEPFEYRLLSPIFWVYVASGQPPRWQGSDLTTADEGATGDILGTVDGDGYLLLVADATTEVVEVRDAADGGAVWVLMVRADELIWMATAAGPAQQMLSLGIGESGLLTELELEVGPTGVITGFRTNMDEWWANAVTIMGNEDQADGARMDIVFRGETFSGALQPEPPCADPVAEVDEVDGQPRATLVCE